MADTASKTKGFVYEFKQFITTGNVVQLAVGVILGAAIGIVIKTFTDGILMQIVAAIFGKPNFDDVTITLRKNVGTDAEGVSIDAELQVGTFINAVIALLLTGLVLFFVVKGYNHMVNRKKATEGPPGPTEVELLTEIRDALSAQR